MLRRTLRMRYAAPSSSESAFTRERHRRERLRSMLYDSDGSLIIGNYLYMLYDTCKKPVALVAAAVAFVYGYEKLILYLSMRETQRLAAIDAQSEQLARQSGKLKKSTYLVKPMRQIDDPDYLDLPSFSGKGTYKSKLFESSGDGDDEVASAHAHADRRHR